MPAFNSKPKPIGKTLLFGVVSFILYAALLSNQDTITHYFTKGGKYALLPIITALAFSYVHGAFTGNFWTSLGVNAKKKKGAH